MPPNHNQTPPPPSATNPQPHPQTIRIIWTVPVYSTTAWLCLRFPENVIYIQCVREVYEAYVIYCFLQYLVYYLGEEHDEMASAKLAKVI